MADRYLEGPIVVFGATGFLGVAVVRELLRVARDRLRSHDNGHTVRRPRIVCVVRSSNLGPGLSSLAPFLEIVRCEKVTDDVLDDLYYNTLRGDVRAFIHVAGMVRHTSDEAEVKEMYASNVVLSDVIFNYAQKQSIRTIYASASGVVGCQFIEDKFRIAHDDGALCTDTIRGLPYYEQKAAIEAKWRPRAAEGICPIVFIRPSTLLGPGDDRLSSSRVVLDFIQARMTFLPKGGISFMDVRDCASAFVTALVCDDSVVSGTVMNLTAANIPFHEFTALLEEVSGVPAPKLELPSTLARAGARLATSYNSLTGRDRDEATDPVYAEAIGQRFWNVTCQRALQLLEFDPRDPITTLKDSARYLRQTYGDKPAPCRRGDARGQNEAMSTFSSSTPSLEKRQPSSAPSRGLLTSASQKSSSSSPMGGGQRPSLLSGMKGRKRLIALGFLSLLVFYGFVMGASSSALTGGQQ